MDAEIATIGKTEPEKPATSGNMGSVKGVPGRHIHNVGIVDLRGVALEEVQQIESLSNIGSVLIDQNQRAALTNARVENVGGIVEVDADFKVLVEPWFEFSRATLEAMTSGQKLYIVGIVFFKQDVTPALITEKFADLRIVGIILATATIQGALIGRAEITGVTATLPDHEMPVVHTIGKNDISASYLKYLKDDSLYINVGHTTILPDVPEELLAQKFATYVNVGFTAAPAGLLDLLKVRCPTNLGEFGIAEAPEG